MNRQPPHQPNDTLAGRYTILGAGRPGPFGFVFKAKDNELGLTVALKVLRADLFVDVAEHEEFLKALKLGRRLSHVHLSRVTAEGEEEGRPYFTSAWLEGETLRTRLSARRAEARFHSLEEVEPLMHQLCAAIEAAHVHGPHSDLKPENIFFVGDSVKVTDFGLGRMPKTSFWSGQKEAGAEAYLAPERESGAGANRAGDIYALGVILGELLWGISPDKGRPSPFPFQPAHSEDVEALYLRAVAAEPSDRFSTPRELYEAFVAVVHKDREARSAPPVELDEGSMKTELMTQVMSFPDVPPISEPDDEEVPTQQRVHLPRPAKEASEAPAKASPPAASSPSALAQDGSPTTALSWSQVQQAPSSKSAAGKDALMWLIVLVLLGILVGTLGGLWVLGRMRKVEPLTAGRVEAMVPAAAERDKACPGGMRRVPGSALAKEASFISLASASGRGRSFCMDEFEFPNQPGERPMVNVTWQQAWTLCASESKRLCTELEWEVTCHGPSRLPFPYGTRFDAEACNTVDMQGARRVLASSGQFARCRSDFGVLDMAGNVAEWTASATSGTSDRVMKGGAFTRSADSSRCRSRQVANLSAKSPEVGFRCCADLN